ncbi:MAG: lycopene cyclase family protein [Sumerlaeia bacterium]
MPSIDADILIAGAGCAGLSLACALVRSASHRRRMIVVDPRTDFPRDRTWCFWDIENLPALNLATYRWPQWRVTTPHGETTRGGTYRYCFLPSDRFYDQALALLKKHPEVHLALGRSVTELLDESDHAAAVLDNGEIIRARAAFDSRPRLPAAPPGPADTDWRQHFAGLTISTREAVFDPRTALLMDFRTRQDHGLHFIYLLPFSVTEALVESTVFSSEILPDEFYEDAVRTYLAEHVGVHDFAVSHRERGVLPMTTLPFDPDPSPRVRRIGIAGGAAKPSSGYAFLAIQRQAAAWAKALAEWDEAAPPPASPPARPLPTRWQDRVFLAEMARAPEAAPELFRRLFERAPADALCRFLSEAPHPLDHLRVMRSVPLARFLLQGGKQAGAMARPRPESPVPER